MRCVSQAARHHAARLLRRARRRQGRWPDLSAHDRAGAGHALLRGRRHGRLGAEAGPPAAARSGRSRGQAPQGADPRARPAARARGRDRPAHLCGRGRPDLPLRSAWPRSGRERRDDHSRVARPAADARRRHEGQAQFPSAEAFRVRCGGAPLRQHRRPVGCLRDQRAGDQALRGGRGPVAIRFRVAVHAAERRFFGAAAGRGRSDT